MEEPEPNVFIKNSSDIVLHDLLDIKPDSALHLIFLAVTSDNDAFICPRNHDVSALRSHVRPSRALNTALLIIPASGTKAFNPGSIETLIIDGVIGCAVCNERLSPRTDFFKSLGP